MNEQDVKELAVKLYAMRMNDMRKEIVATLGPNGTEADFNSLVDENRKCLANQSIMDACVFSDAWVDYSNS